MRIKNSIKNSIVGISATVVDLLGQFILRRLFVLYLGQYLYGLNGIFATFISVLSLAELGVGSVICFSLYKPLADNDQNDIIALMQLFRKYYRYIAIAVLTLGLLSLPFIPYIVGSSPLNLPYIYLIYAFFVSDSFLSYFFSYNKIFLVAIQKNYIVNLVRIIFASIGTALVILIMFFTNNYIDYLIGWVTLRVIENMISYMIVRRKYPFLSTKVKHFIETEKKNKLTQNIKALIYHQVGGVLVLNSDTLVLAKIGGVIAAGLYTNYLMIISGVYKLTTQIFDGVRASFGDFAAQKSKQDTEDLFYLLQFFAFILFTWCSSCILNLCQPVITLWMGAGSQFSFVTVVVLVINFYLRGMRLPIDVMKDVKGIYWQDRYKPFLEGIVKLTFSILLGLKFGLNGILLGTTISTVSVLLTIEPYVVYKYGFEKTFNIYYIKYFGYLITAAVACGLSVFFNSLIITDNIFILIFIRLIISTVVTIFICSLFYFKSEEFKRFFALIKQIILKDKRNY